jgi:transketolase
MKKEPLHADAWMKEVTAVEAGKSQGWHRYAAERGDMLSVGRFGSTPGDVVVREYRFNAENVCRRALALMQ